MKVQAQLNNLRIAPRKVRLVADRVRGLQVDKALGMLEYELKQSGDVIAKLVRSASANGAHNFKMQQKNLVIEDIQVNEGPTMKRWRARAYGRAAQILKRTSKITVILSDGKDSIPEKPKSAKKTTIQEKAPKTATKKTAKKVAKKVAKK